MKNTNGKINVFSWGLILATAALFAACGGDSSSGADEGEISSSMALSSSVESSSSGTEVKSSSSSVAAISYGEITDSRDKQKYKTVVIGTQTWMAENLNYAVDSSWCYNDSTKYCEKYGRLYQWTAAMGLSAEYNETEWEGNDMNYQGICPEGWRLPNNDDWWTLLFYVEANNGSEEIGASLKSASGWFGDVAGTNRFGFSALPAGERNSNRGFYYAGYYAHFWSALEWYDDSAYYWYLSYNFGVFYEGNELNKYYGNNRDKITGFSVRCLKK